MKRVHNSVLQHLAALSLVAVLVDCTPSAELRLGRPIGYNAGYAEHIMLCVTELIDDSGRDHVLDGHELRLSEPIELAGSHYRVRIRECTGRLGLVGATFEFNLTPVPSHRYEILVSLYSTPMHDFERPSRVASSTGDREGDFDIGELQLRNATINQIISVARPMPASRKHPK
jgi:hypothetical protein